MMVKKSSGYRWGGFNCSTLVRQLLENGYEVTVFDNLSVGLRDDLPRNENLRLIADDVRDFELVSEAVHGHPLVMYLVV